MLFDSPVYFLFLIPIVAIYWRLQRRAQNLMLLGASYFFYGWWNWRFVSLILISTVVDYFAARYIAQSKDPFRRKALLTLSLVLNFGFLGVFKYYNFFADSLATLLTSLGFPHSSIVTLRILLPPGISFYTFQAVAYIVDVYFKKLEPAESLVDYALFISLFPHLIAGPIQRPSHLLPQVVRDRFFDAQRFSDGILLILCGLFRKCVVADNCALLADAAFNGSLGTPSLGVNLIGIYAFAWQIYADFSGYSDIARGSAQIMGFHFMVNFRQPYLACSLQDFWRRWHISLSTWLRDYLYIPLGGNRYGEAKTYRNLMVTMLLGGLWHGANWTFVIWGGIHGVWLSLERLFRGGEREQSEAERSAAAWLKRIAIFHLVCLTWVFFRAQSLAAAVDYLRAFAVLRWEPQLAPAILFLCGFTIPMFLLDLSMEARREEYYFQFSPDRLRMAVGVAAIALVVLFAGNLSNAFIYFQF
jgi:alginate O-acetyltransferase complex protein AlgI